MSAHSPLVSVWLRAVRGTAHAITRVKTRLTGSYYLHDKQQLRGRRHLLSPCDSAGCSHCNSSGSTHNGKYARRAETAATMVTLGMLESAGEPAPITGAHRFNLSTPTVEGPRPYVAEQLPAGRAS